MAGILNNTARQYNLKCVRKSDGARVTVRVAPGFNVVDDDHWGAFVPKDKKDMDPYVAQLQKEGKLEFGTDKVEDMEMEKDPDTKSKSKVAPKPTEKKDK